MFDYHQELERRIAQFAGYLKQMYHRAHEEVGGPCFILFEERKPSEGTGDAALSKAAKSARAFVGTAFGENLESGILIQEDLSPVDLPDGGWRQDDSQNRFVQFSVERNWFCLDMPLQTLYRAEAEQILRSRHGFFYLRDLVLNSRCMASMLMVTIHFVKSTSTVTRLPPPKTWLSSSFRDIPGDAAH